MAQMQPSTNPWITSYINQNNSSKSRYEIDQFLIEAGYAPDQIEKAWRLFLHPNTTPPESAILPFIWFRRGLWLVNSFLVALILVIYLFASFQLAKEGRTEFLFLTINSTIMHAAVIMLLASMLGFILLIGGVLVRKNIWHGDWRIMLVVILLLIVFISIPRYFYDNDLIENCLLAVVATNSWTFPDFNKGIRGWSKSLIFYLIVLFIGWLLYLFLSVITCGAGCYP